MRVAGRLAASAGNDRTVYQKPGVTTGEFQSYLQRDYIVNEQHAISAPALGYHGYPKSVLFLLLMKWCATAFR